MAASSSNAYDFEKDGFYYNITSVTDLTVQLTTSGEASEYGDIIATYSGDIVVPRTVEYSNRTFTVTSINPYAFIGCSLPSLTIPETIVDIDKSGDNMGLAGVFGRLIIEDSDTPIHCFRALVSCFNGDVTESVYLGRNIEGQQEDNIVYYHSHGGSYKEITFGEKVTYLNDACVDCDNLTSVILPRNIKKLNETFFNCDNLVSISGEGIEVANGAFSCCTKLTSVNLPSVRVIDNAFTGCSFSSFVVPQGVVSMIGSFTNCSNLESITIPSTTININDTYGYDPTFGGCNALKTIVVGNPTPIKLNEKNFESLVFLNATLKVPVGAKEAYQSAEGWKNFFNIEEDASITDDIFVLTQEMGYSWGGTIEVNTNEALPAYDAGYSGTYKFVKKGENVEIKAIPDNNYKLSSLMVNGTDVIADVVDNIYNTPMTGSMVISASFEYDNTPHPEEPIFLTIKQADNGSIKQRIWKWDSFTFYIEPADGWRLHTVTFNEKDVTSQIGTNGLLELYDITDNAVLSISYELDDEISVKGVQSSRAKIYSLDNLILVSNAEIGELIQIFNESGMNVVNIHANNVTESIQVEKGHVYIVKLKGKTVKISI